MFTNQLLQVALWLDVGTAHTTVKGAPELVTAVIWDLVELRKQQLLECLLSGLQDPTRRKSFAEHRSRAWSARQPLPAQQQQSKSPTADSAVFLQAIIHHVKEL